MNFLYFVVPVPFLVLSFPLGKRHHPATSILLIHSALVLAAIVIRSCFTHTQPHLPSLAQSAATLAPRKSRKQWAAFLATRWATSFLEPGRFFGQRWLTERLTLLTKAKPGTRKSWFQFFCAHVFMVWRVFRRNETWPPSHASNISGCA